jgi:hypothetical protein
MIEERAKRARADILRADQPQAVEPFGTGELANGRSVVHGASFAQPKVAINQFRALAASALVMPGLVRLVPGIQVLQL